MREVRVRGCQVELGLEQAMSPSRWHLPCPCGPGWWSGSWQVTSIRASSRTCEAGPASHPVGTWLRVWLQSVRGTRLESAAREAPSLCWNWHVCGLTAPPSSGSQLRIHSKLEVSHKPGLFLENFTAECSWPLLQSHPFSAHSSCLTSFQRLSPQCGHVPACGCHASKPPYSCPVVRHTAAATPLSW